MKIAFELKKMQQSKFRSVGEKSFKSIRSGVIEVLMLYKFLRLTSEFFHAVLSDLCFQFDKRCLAKMIEQKK